ncbi:ACT domain-containing protein [Vibrio zhugei]|uniref:ACT domain-containing protein n=1 Tax=Vibrio zhugei TaxID=2479546 RepID=A0ABV7C9U3_9VIBR|nr:ACT domain-containing protein [Vibrio zhugei]
MSGITELDELLRSMRPKLIEGEFVFCTVSGHIADYVELAPLAPLALFRESEGLTLVLDKSVAESAGLSFEGVYRQITLTVHSSLEAVGLTAAVAKQLASQGISTNVIAAYYHDHIFVPANKASAALSALEAFHSDEC